MAKEKRLYSSDLRYSQVCEIVATNFVDKLASFYILCAVSRAKMEPYAFDELHIPELDRYLDQESTAQYWEERNLSHLQSLYLEAIFQYCSDIAGKWPISSEEELRERWTNNIKRGLKALRLDKELALIQ